MSDRASALYSHLLSDLADELDEDQLRLIGRKGSNIWPDASLKEARCFFLAKSIVKKYNDAERPSQVASEAGLQKFLEGNEQCANWRLRCDTDRDMELVQGVRNTLYDFWYVGGDKTVPLVSSLNQLWTVGRTGPGASRYARGDDTYTKLFDSPLSSTSEGLAYAWSKLASEDPRWCIAERHRNQRYGSKLVSGNKLSFVNKTTEVARSISTEPTINMWFQLGLGSYLEDRLRSRWGVDLSTQPEVNRDLAETGSRSGLFATIDLENASNSLSNAMVKEVVPADMLVWLNLLRSRTVELPDGSVRDLEMIATMGNGFCFPLQTLIFLAAVVTAYQHLGIEPQGFGPSSSRNFGVFGDDIIVVSDAAPLVIRILEILGLKTNADKTFVEGPFRESCGGDFWNGHYCRGVYVKTLRTKQAVWVAVNTLNRWTAMSGVYLPNTVRYLLSLVPSSGFVPFDESDDAGIHAPLARSVSASPYPGLHTYHCSRPKKFELEVTEQGEVVLTDEVRRTGQKPRKSNIEGLYLAFLHGTISRYHIGLRMKRVRYVTRRRVTPRWDHVPATASRRYVTGPRLIDAVERNIFLPF